jgi:hypothetical protein
MDFFGVVLADFVFDRLCQAFIGVVEAPARFVRGSMGTEADTATQQAGSDTDANVSTDVAASGVNGQRFGVIRRQFFGNDGVLFDNGALGGIKGLVGGAGRE